MKTQNLPPVNYTQQDPPYFQQEQLESDDFPLTVLV